MIALVLAIVLGLAVAHPLLTQTAKTRDHAQSVGLPIWTTVLGSPLTGPGTVMVLLRSGTLVLQSFVVTKPTYMVTMNFVLGLPNASAKVELGLYVNGRLMSRFTQIYSLSPPSEPGLPAPNLSNQVMGMFLNTTFAADTVVTAAVLVLNGTVIVYTVPPTGGLGGATITTTYSLPLQLPTSAGTAPWSLSGVTGIDNG